jgi:hypothetical protein
MPQKTIIKPEGDLKKKPTVDMLKMCASCLDKEHPFHKLKKPNPKDIEKMFIKKNSNKKAKKKI